MSDADEAVRAVQERIERDREFLIGLTRDLVRIPTVNRKFEADPEINREAELQTHLAGIIREIGLEPLLWDALPDRPNLIASQPGSESRSLILCGHVDVVPVGDRSLWTVEPFDGEVKDGKLWGRGAVDMKGGLAANVTAVRAIRACGIELQGRLDLHCVVDEEAGGFGAIEAVKRGHLAQAVLVSEPTWGDVLPAEGGLEWARVTIRGRSGHSAWRYNELYPQSDRPDRLVPSVSAIDLGTRFLDALRQFEHDIGRSRSHPLLPPGVNSINVGAVVAGTGLGPDGRPSGLGNPAIVPDVFTADLDIKFLPHETSAQVRAEFEAFVHAFSQASAWLREHPPMVAWELHGLRFPPMDTGVDHALVRSLVARRRALGRDTAIKGFIAVCDAAHYAGAGVPGVIYGPSGDGLHGADEHVEIESLAETAKVIAAAAIDFCGVR